MSGSLIVRRTALWAGAAVLAVGIGACGAGTHVDARPGRAVPAVASVATATPSPSSSAVPAPSGGSSGPGSTTTSPTEGASAVSSEVASVSARLQTLTANAGQINNDLSGSDQAAAQGD
jgi:hypothetical protein